MLDTQTKTNKMKEGLEKSLNNEVVSKILDNLYEINSEQVKNWIYKKFPHGIGLYE